MFPFPEPELGEQVSQSASFSTHQARELLPEMAMLNDLSRVFASELEAKKLRLAVERLSLAFLIGSPALQVWIRISSSFLVTLSTRIPLPASSKPPRLLMVSRAWVSHLSTPE